MKKIILLLLIVHCTLNIKNCICQWQPDVRLTNNSADSRLIYNNQHKIATNGNFVHVVWYDFRYGGIVPHVYYKRSTDRGMTWGADIRLSDSIGWGQPPSISVSGSFVHVVWGDSRSGSGCYEIYYKRSTDAGTTWGADTRLTFNGTSTFDALNPDISVSGSFIRLVWMDYRNGQPNPEIYYKYSTDGGTTWGADTRLTNASGFSRFPSISLSGSVVHLVWCDDRDTGNENYEIYYKRSTNGGTTWGADTRLTNDTANSYVSAFSSYQSNIYIVWSDNRNSGVYLLYYKHSTDGGTTWGTDTRLTNESNIAQTVPSITVSGLIWHVTWIDSRDGNAEIYYKRSVDGGINWGADTRLTNNTSNSGFNALSVSDSVVHVIWEDNRDGNYEIYYKRNPTGNPLLKAFLTNVYRPNDGRTQYANLTLSDSLSWGQIDSVYWYVNDSLVGRQHSMTYNYKQGTAFVKLKLKNNVTGFDSTTAFVSRIAWKRYTNGQILAGLSMIGDSILYAISTGDAVYKMDINGNINYTLTVLGNVTSSCSIGYDTTVFIASDANNLYGFNRYGGQMWAPISLGGQASATPTIDSISNRIYIGVSNGNFQAYNKVSGTYAWSTFLNAPIKSSAVVSYDRKLVVASAAGTIYGFNLNLSNPVPPNWQLSLSDSIFVSPAIDSNGYFYFGSRSGKVYKISMTGTSNTGIVWQTPLASAITSSPTIDANGNIYVGTADGKFYSLNKNGGIRWFLQTPAQIKSTAAITTYQRIYFGNDAGEIYGLDTNKNIQFYYIDSSKISCAMLHQKGTLYFGNEAGRIFALYDPTGGTKGPVKPVWGTFQNNIRRTGNQIDEEYSIGLKKISEFIPEKFELFQNYPNPFNPNTIIRFQIKDSRFVSLKLYDILGREVMTLVNEKLEPGNYSINFDGKMLSSGIYYYKLTAGEFSEIKKMVLLK